MLKFWLVKQLPLDIDIFNIINHHLSRIFFLCFTDEGVRTDGANVTHSLNNIWYMDEDRHCRILGNYIKYITFRDGKDNHYFKCLNYKIIEGTFDFANMFGDYYKSDIKLLIYQY
jgi:hypothetical protein